MAYPALYRKRLIPDECILLDKDEILEFSDDMIVTRWQVLRPRKDFSHGLSIYYPKKGYKVSEFYNEQNDLVYVYCDIITVSTIADKCIVTDLLADVIIYPDNSVKVVDIAEISDALDQDILSVQLAKHALRTLDSLLSVIYSGKLPDLLSPLDRYR